MAIAVSFTVSAGTFSFVVSASTAVLVGAAGSFVPQLDSVAAPKVAMSNAAVEPRDARKA
ncbi:MAG: hypothetical protein C0520_16290 [Sphingopyxis sp.]|nr:hypothetical protein [Sphingopyxis sp.]